MRKLIPLLAAAVVTLGTVAAAPRPAAAQPMPVQWGYAGGGYGGGYYAPPPPPPPPPWYGRPHFHRGYYGGYGPAPYAYVPPPPPRWGGWYR